MRHLNETLALVQLSLNKDTRITIDGLQCSGGCERPWG